MRTIDALADLLLGSACPGCGEPGWGVCRRCRDEVARPRLQVNADGVVVIGLTGYEGVGGRLVRALKDGGAWSVARVCGPGLGAAVDLLDGRGVALVPAPSSADAVRRRGFHHSRALASATARRQDQVVDALSRVRQVADQAGLDHDDRLTNQNGSMRASSPVHGRAARAVIVDDVCTTGATISAARVALESGGWTVLGAVVVAVTAKHDQVRNSHS